GDALFAGLYINELLVKTLGREEPVADLFDSYDAAVASLARIQSSTFAPWAPRHSSPGDGKRRGFGELEPILRTFERRLLD
ncbi:DNA repair protein RecO C-terminal domain-containing protein, partial [Methylobacterium crusticola]|uniref:DNA repair protein RecO C-terminal domain-containing protein n=1 Tax=Methylobacterium crusticola TaxID=1697972 RepID=UPI001EE3333D